MKYVVLYSPSSVQRIMDFIKTVYAFRDFTPVIVKPIGAGAQIGVPEAYRYSYKAGKSLIVLPELSDLRETLGISENYYISTSGVERDISFFVDRDGYALIFSDGESEPSKKELLGIEIVKVKNIPLELPASSTAALIMYFVNYRLFTQDTT